MLTWHNTVAEHITSQGACHAAQPEVYLSAAMVSDINSLRRAALSGRGGRFVPLALLR